MEARRLPDPFGFDSIWQCKAACFATAFDLLAEAARRLSADAGLPPGVPQASTMARVPACRLRPRLSAPGGIRLSPLEIPRRRAVPPGRLPRREFCDRLTFLRSIRTWKGTPAMLSRPEIDSRTPDRSLLSGWFGGGVGCDAVAVVCGDVQGSYGVSGLRSGRLAGFWLGLASMTWWRWRWRCVRWSCWWRCLGVLKAVAGYLPGGCGGAAGAGGSGVGDGRGCGCGWLVGVGRPGAGSGAGGGSGW